MRASLAALLLVLLFLLFTAGCKPADKTPRETGAAPGASATPPVAVPAPRVDYDALARRLVEQSARIREGELVLIAGSPRDLELLENLAVATRARGAHPLVALSTERMARLMFDRVSPKYDGQAPAFDLKLAGIVNANLTLDVGDNPSLLEGIPAERLSAQAKAAAAVNGLLRKRKVRNVNLGNGLYPTDAAAARFGMTKVELAKIFWDGVNVDYAQLQATGEVVRKQLTAGRVLRLTNPNGTDLRVGIAGRPVYVSDGVISADDERLGGGALNVWLPAGEVYVLPVPGTAEGTVVADRYFVEGQTIEGLTLEFKAGKLVSLAARSPIDRLKAFYDAAGPGREALGVIDIGINPNVRNPAGARLVGWMPAGMVTVSVGNDTWAGGDNDVGFALSPFLPGSTLTVDGTPIIENGVLRLPAVLAAAR